MLTIFNRKEVFSTFSAKEQTETCSLLNQSNIHYYMRIINQEGAGFFGSTRRGNFGSFGMNQDVIRQYIIYVHKKDFEKSDYLIHNNFEK